MTTMYARDSKGKIKQWSIFIEDIEAVSIITTTFGSLNGKMQTSRDIISSGKNIGKANQTTIRQQADSELHSKVEDQRKKGYKTLEDLGYEAGDIQNNDELKDYLEEKLSVTNTDNNDNIIPMKCQKYYKEVKDKITKEVKEVPRITFPCIAQPKLNGVRCIILWENGKVVIRSKKGLDYTILDHIESAFNRGSFIRVKGDTAIEDLVYDGELYVHNVILSDIVSAVRVRSLLTQAIQFWCFDLAIPDLSNVERDTLRNKRLIGIRSSVVNVPGTIVETHEEAIVYATSEIDAGYEGAIFRNPDALYGFGTRPQTIVKYKEYQDAEFEIVNVIPQEKRQDLALFVCITKDGSEFEVNPEGSTELRQQYLIDRDKLIGKMATIKYYELSVNNIPFHAKLTTIRDYED